MALTDLNVQGKRVLVRVDFNVPLDDQFNVQDDTRIRRALPTIKYLLAEGASVVLMSHLNRPKGISPEFSLKHIVSKLEDLLYFKAFISHSDCIGDKALDITQNLKPGDLALLENLRFHKEEKEGDEFFASIS